MQPPHQIGGRGVVLEAELAQPQQQVGRNRAQDEDAGAGFGPGVGFSCARQKGALGVGRAVDVGDELEGAGVGQDEEPP